MDDWWFKYCSNFLILFYQTHEKVSENVEFSLSDNDEYAAFLGLLFFKIVSIKPHRGDCL